MLRPSVIVFPPTNVIIFFNYFQRCTAKEELGKTAFGEGLLRGLNTALSVAGHFTSLHRTTNEFGRNSTEGSVLLC